MEKALQQIKNDTRAKAGFIIAFILLLSSFFISIYTNKQTYRQSQLVDHTYKVISDLESLVSTVRDAETGLRGFVITRNRDFLTPYFGTHERADSIYEILWKKTEDNPLQQQRLKRLQKPLTRRFAIFEYSLSSSENNDRYITDSMRALQAESNQTSTVIRNTVTQMEDYERELLQKRDDRLKKTFDALNMFTIISMIVALILVAFGILTYLREYKARLLASKRIKDYQEELRNRIKELDRANKELLRMRSQEKFAATGRIARTIAHEVRNPLTNINLAADQLKAEYITADENSEYLFDIITRNSKRINQLISDLLQSTKFSDLNFEKISVNDLLDEVLLEAGDRIALTNVEVVRQYSKDICTISADKAKLRIAFLNIIINAVEAMEEKQGGQLILETKGEDNKCKVIISDTGTGMDSEAMSKLFEPYFTSKRKGNGLGLTNTQNIILNHKGDISVQSKPGQGTVFTITLDFA